jgi:predicted peptidase
MNNFLSQRRIVIPFVLMLITFAACSDSGSDGPVSNDLASLPEDTGGTHTAKPRGTTTADFGYYVYLPGGYEKGTHNYPLLIFLHGQGERGNGTTDLDKVLYNGPPKLIKGKNWNPKFPMIVVSPQHTKMEEGESTTNWGGGNPAHLKKFIEYLMDTYRVNESRIYLTGLSHGGNGVFDYLTKHDPSYIAAAAPVACYGPGSGYSKAKNIPIWVFVGDKDNPNFDTSKRYVENYNKQSPAPKHKAKLTVFADAGHDVWTRTYSGSGIGTADDDFDPFNISLYEWMLQYSLEEN